MLEKEMICEKCGCIMDSWKIVAFNPTTFKRWCKAYRHFEVKVMDDKDKGTKTPKKEG
jgi:hypothetical protein